MKCPLCGYRFDVRPGSCRRCGLRQSCELICCPRCGYTYAERSAIVSWVERLWKKVKGERSGTD